MTKIVLNGIISAAILLCINCQSEDTNRFEKTLCFEKKNKLFQKHELYISIQKAFLDTFNTSLKKTHYFNSSQTINKLDDAVFLKSDSTECLMIVLQKDVSSPLFGKSRIIHGFLDSLCWKFEVSMEILFSKDFFEPFPENDFQTLSRLARYNVLSKGHPKKGGCGIDEVFWFDEMKD
jgi:hypothetical protein